MIRTPVAVAASGALGVAGAWSILTNAYPDEGPWLPISPSHGIHIGDVVIVLVWGGATWVLLRWARRGRRRSA